MCVCSCALMHACNTRRTSDQNLQSWMHCYGCSNSIVWGYDGILRVGFLASRLCPLPNVKNITAPTVFMLQSTSWESHTFSVGQDTQRIFWKPSPPLLSVMSQMNSVISHPILFLKAHSNVSLLSTLPSLVLHACHMPNPLDLPRYDSHNPRCVGREIQLWNRSLCNFLRFLLLANRDVTSACYSCVLGYTLPQTLGRAEQRLNVNLFWNKINYISYINWKFLTGATLFM
jgi:hypothetical protein